MKYVSHVSALIGAGLVVFGMALIAQALGLIVLGGMLVAFGVIREGGF